VGRFWWLQGVELRASHLLGSFCTTSGICPALLLWLFWGVQFCVFAWGRLDWASPTYISSVAGWHSLSFLNVIGWDRVSWHFAWVNLELQSSLYPPPKKLGLRYDPPHLVIFYNFLSGVLQHIQRQHSKYIPWLEVYLTDQELSPPQVLINNAESGAAGVTRAVKKLLPNTRPLVLKFQYIKQNTLKM
jgi:hypothetical protein